MAWTEVTFDSHTNEIWLGLSLLFSNLFPYRIGLCLTEVNFMSTVTTSVFTDSEIPTWHGPDFTCTENLAAYQVTSKFVPSSYRYRFVWDPGRVHLLRRKLANTRLVINLGPTTCQRTCYEPVTSKLWTCIEKGSQCVISLKLYFGITTGYLLPYFSQLLSKSTVFSYLLQVAKWPFFTPTSLCYLLIEAAFSLSPSGDHQN